MASIDDTLVSKLVLVEQDNLRQMTGQASGTVPTYTPVAFTSTGQVD